MTITPIYADRIEQMTQGVGASLAGPGSCPSGQAPAGLAGCAAAIPRAGQWVLFKASTYNQIAVEIKRADKVTPKMVKFDGASWPRQCGILDVVAAFDDEATAKDVRNKIAGVAGEYERRRRLAESEESARILSALTAANKQVARIVAQAMSARSAEEHDNVG